MPPRESPIQPVEGILRQTTKFSRAASKVIFRQLVRSALERGPSALLNNPALIISDMSQAVEEALAPIEVALADSLIAGWVGGAANVEDLQPPAVVLEIIEALFPEDPVAQRLVSTGVGLIAESFKRPKGPPTPKRPLTLIYGPREGPFVRFPVIEEAVRTLNDRQVVTPERFRQLDGQARQTAFTITADVKKRTLAKALEVISDTVKITGNREKFEARIRKEFGKKLPISDAHLEQVFRNNVNTAYSNASEELLDRPIVEDAFPFRAYFAIRDDRVREEHLAMEQLGIEKTNIYWKGDPVWRDFRPPWSWNCRCGWVAMTISDAATSGLRVAQKWLQTGVRPKPSDLTVKYPPWEPPPGWQRGIRRAA